MEILYAAISDGNVQRVVSILNDPSTPKDGGFGAFPLHDAVRCNGQVDILELLIMRLLIMRGADIDLQNLAQHTALHLACLFGLAEHVRLLLQHKVKLYWFPPFSRPGQYHSNRSRW